MTDLYLNDDSYHGGAFMLAANDVFYGSAVIFLLLIPLADAQPVLRATQLAEFATEPKGLDYLRYCVSQLKREDQELAKKHLKFE